MPEILLIGPGAIGATLTAWLSQDPRNSVAVAARTPFEAIETQTPERLLHARPRVFTGISQATPVDWVLVSTKTYDSDAAARWFPAAVGPGTRVAVIQNGVEHVERFEKHLPRERILPVMIDLPVDRLGPGRTRQRGAGRILVPRSEAGAGFVRLFEHTALDAAETGDFTSALWRKLCLNCAGAVNAVLLEPARIAHHDGVADLMRALVRECMAVGRAEGAVLDDGIPDEIVDGARRAPPETGNSLLADRRAGRPLEHDARNGVIVRRGRAHGIATPMNALMVALLEASATPPG